MLTIFFIYKKPTYLLHKAKKSKLFKPLNKNFISNLSHKSLKLFEDHYLDDSVRDNIFLLLVTYRMSKINKIYFYHFFLLTMG